VSERPGRAYDLDRLRAAFAEPDEPPHPDRCPPPGEIWAGVHGELPPARLREIVEHLAACAPCAEAWRVALIMERPEGAEGAPAEELVQASAAARGSRFRPGWRLYGALGAAAAAVFAVVLGTHDLRRAAPPAVPGIVAERGSPAGARTATRWLTPNEAVLPRTGARLRWSGPPGATYDVTIALVDERGATQPVAIAEARGLEVTEYLLPARDLQRVPPQAPAARLQATLTAHLPDGRSEILFRDLRLP